MRRRSGLADPVKDMHYAEFAEDEVSSTGSCAETVTYEQQSVALREAIREYEANKWKAIGAKLGKPAKVSSRPLFYAMQF